jgi:hypothetical protein
VGWGGGLGGGGHHKVYFKALYVMYPRLPEFAGSMMRGAHDGLLCPAERGENPLKVY